MPQVAKWVNTDLSKGFSVLHVAQKHDWHEPLVLDPMAGGGVCADTCLAPGRRCWTLTHVIQAPMSSERFTAGVVSAMQKKKILVVTSRYVMILK